MPHVLVKGEQGKRPGGQPGSYPASVPRRPRPRPGSLGERLQRGGWTHLVVLTAGLFPDKPLAPQRPDPEFKENGRRRQTPCSLNLELHVKPTSKPKRKAFCGGRAIGMPGRSCRGCWSPIVDHGRTAVCHACCGSGPSPCSHIKCCDHAAPRVRHQVDCSLWAAQPLCPEHGPLAAGSKRGPVFVNVYHCNFSPDQGSF